LTLYLLSMPKTKSIASTTTYPLQVIKSRLQQRSQAIELSESSGEIIVTKREYSGVTDCVGKILKNEGISGFFKGCLTNAIRVAPSAAITFVVYEWVLDILSDW
jgi:solute carrier family 25 folate transporter 32